MAKMKNQDWYSRIEEPLKELVYLLRNNGFNTTCSCGHYPRPYIEMEDSEDRIKDLYNLLKENGYKHFTIKFMKESGRVYSGNLEVIFVPKMPLAKLSDIKEIDA